MRRSPIRSAATVAAAHASAPVVEAEPWIDALGDYIEQNDAAFREQPELFPPARGRALTGRAAPHTRA